MMEMKRDRRKTREMRREEGDEGILQGMVPVLGARAEGFKVTPVGYAWMTHMLTSLPKRKLLVILEGGYNLRSISSSATEVVKVLLGEDPRYDTSSIIPSKPGLYTILQVLKIQLKFWPSLKPSYTTLQSQWGLVSSNNSIYLGPLPCDPKACCHC